MSFLAYLFHKENCSYVVIAVTRFALSPILPLKEQKTFSECQKVCKMSKGLLKLGSIFPKYTVICSPDIIFMYMDTLPNNSSLLLEDLTKTLYTLLCLLSGQRCQTIAASDLNFSSTKSNWILFITEKFEIMLWIVSVNIYVEPSCLERIQKVNQLS